MVTWNEDTPDGAKSLSVNTPKMLENTAYTKAKLGLDHYWSSGDDTKDGYHKYAQMTKNGGDTPVDPTLAGAMDSVYYAKKKTAAESVAQQDVQPFFLTAATAVMQILGIRAMALFDVDPTTKAITIQYSHNVTSVTRTAASLYTITFTNALPSANYLAMGSGMGGSAIASSPCYFSVQSAVALATSKTTALCKIRLVSSSAGTPASTDPLQGWVIMFGG